MTTIKTVDLGIGLEMVHFWDCSWSGGRRTVFRITHCEVRMWHFLRLALQGSSAAIVLAACAGDATLVVPRATSAARAARDLTAPGNYENPNSAAGVTKGFIHGWLDGQTVMLRYTKMYFCAEPPHSAVSTGCEVGAGPTIAPRSGLIPTIYVLAPLGFSPDPSTVHCPEGIVCLNHPPSLDLSRVGGPDSVFSPAHSHIVTDQQAGWHQTVTIPVTSLDAWNEIAGAKRLTKVRELQAARRLGPDAPTNLYFFFEVQGTNPNK
jgi:hypothetical protein